MIPRKYTIIGIILIIVLVVSLLVNFYLYKANSEMADRQYIEFVDAQRSLLYSTEEYIDGLEEVNQSEDFDVKTLQVLSSSMMTSINEHHQSSLVLYGNFTNFDNINRYQSEFLDLWEVGLTEVSDVETQEELSTHIKELKRLFRNFEEDMKKY
ncbi:hypothetical protein [Pontibacillus sp. HMF3514]|uniref:hypothetical protein n=1 Tax=Pontibacillus sp. HMF3514 TaxID=2692425 RepID=UPI0013203380|nr:hypothetical protein [Pontibacillus sp. HMF3514]QHE51566.1 hypothetical protein GS400_05740 [Pontibacillus sp. HMF3514]